MKSKTISHLSGVASEGTRTHFTVLVVHNPAPNFFAVLDGSTVSYESASALNLTAGMASRPVVPTPKQPYVRITSGLPTNRKLSAQTMKKGLFR
jgi:hypothetical protein